MQTAQNPKKKPLTDAQVIEGLGGAAQVRKTIKAKLDRDLTLTAISMWKIRRIPPEFRPFIEGEALAAGLNLPANFVLRAH